MAVTPVDPPPSPHAAGPSTPPRLPYRCDRAIFDESVIIGVRGDVDLKTAPDFEGEMFAVLALPLHTVVIDLGYCTFMDSSGVGAIVAYAGSRNGGGPVVLLNPSAGILRLFEISCLAQHPKIEVRHTDGSE